MSSASPPRNPGQFKPRASASRATTASLASCARPSAPRLSGQHILCWGNLDDGTALIDRHPDTRFIIDHLGILQLRTPPAPPQAWADLAKPPADSGQAKGERLYLEIRPRCVSNHPRPLISLGFRLGGAP